MANYCRFTFNDGTSSTTSDVWVGGTPYFQNVSANLPYGATFKGWLTSHCTVNSLTSPSTVLGILANEPTASLTADFTPATPSTQYGTYKSWIPFVVSIAKSTVIASATLELCATETNTATGGSYVTIGCENSANAVAPTTYSELNMRTFGANTITDLDTPIWVAGTKYTYDVTACVQEILNLATWVSGNTLAIMTSGSSPLESRKTFASYENVTYAEPKLVIVY